MRLYSLIAYLGVVALLPWIPCQARYSQPAPRNLEQLSSAQLVALVGIADPVKNVDPRDPQSHLSKILIPRPAGSDNSTFVRNYIVQTLTSLDWYVEEDSFTDFTPYGERTFTNIIATKDPNAPRRVILSAHYDSKYFPDYPNNQFVGATDSAAPCAMMLDVAEALNPLLDRRRQQIELEDEEDIEDISLQLVFFDGEEAFKTWTGTDSIYGARHLSEKWSSTYIAPYTKRRLLSHASVTELTTIEHLILLDLLGAPNPSVRSYFIDTAWLFDTMVSVEERLHQAGLLADSESTMSFRSFFLPRRGTEFNYGYIEDDHVPFLRKGVSVLHVIPYQFPAVWHTLQDDASALDVPTMRRWNLILRIFMCEYLGLGPVITSNSNYDRIHRSMGELGIQHSFTRHLHHTQAPMSAL
ncbi:hypothetical protein EDC04DRAFT_2633810 [Pisolithus marmoratus]|nr:hypothetical protein EDC04DRAFT_2633810 [Pisolithus marmoratus]